MALARIVAICALCFLYSGFTPLVTCERDDTNSQTVAIRPVSYKKIHCRNSLSNPGEIHQKISQPIRRRTIKLMLSASLRLGARVIEGIKRALQGCWHKTKIVLGSVSTVSPMNSTSSHQSKSKVTANEKTVQISSIKLFDQILLNSNNQTTETPTTPIEDAVENLFILSRNNVDAVTKAVSGASFDLSEFLRGFFEDDFKRSVSNFFTTNIALADSIFGTQSVPLLLSLLLVIIGIYVSLSILQYIVTSYNPPTIAGQSYVEPESPDNLKLSTIALEKGYEGREELKEQFDVNDEDDSLNIQFSESDSSTVSAPITVAASLSEDTGDVWRNVTSSERERMTERITELDVEHVADSVFDQISSTVIPLQQVKEVSPIDGNDDNKDNSFTVRTIFETTSTSIDSVSSTHVSPSFTPAKPVIRRSFHCISPFDENGIIVFLTSKVDIERNKKAAVRAKMSTVFMGSESTVIAHATHDVGLHSMPNYTRNEVKSWCAIDLGTGRRLIPTQYCIRHGASSAGNAMRNWELRAREKDTDRWDVLKIHVDDDKLSDIPTSVALWDISCFSKKEPLMTDDNDKIIIPNEISDECSSRGYRYFMILQTGVNSSGNNCLFIGGIEFYGSLTEKVSTQPKQSLTNI